jgi:hypothetical protein
MYLGEYKDTWNTIPVVAVICDGRKVTTTSESYKVGKHTENAIGIVIND